MRHIISVLLQNEAGALTRVASLFSTRGYNIESLSVAPTEDPLFSRLTLVTLGSDQVIDQINKQLLKLVDVVGMADMTRGDHIERELLLLKAKVPDASSRIPASPPSAMVTSRPCRCRQTSMAIATIGSSSTTRTRGNTVSFAAVRVERFGTRVS